ncbi:Ribosomal RNA small subunit methyltransferase H [Porphyridium purpureum]|uniref:Ribosomal RNA small subunit methyltransferase H n=1 Tax=Porphyridium purpureum TaxID=35688 RepID=A0A5J4Z817_PORPP|nr:Ribosomal RNA small subunit methyltransferase H [Porphyridium purpureum]|eukprot:POR2026..scf295_1
MTAAFVAGTCVVRRWPRARACRMPILWRAPKGRRRLSGSVLTDHDAGCDAVEHAERADLPHEGVLSQQVVEQLLTSRSRPESESATGVLTTPWPPVRIVVDGTVGAGYHASTLLQACPSIEQYIAFDQDESALTIAQRTLHPWRDKVRFVHANFAEMRHELLRLGSDVYGGVDAILLDIGVSSMQLDNAERGFSFMRAGPLDMRMNPRSRETAADVVNRRSEEELGYILKTYGEEPRWRKLAARIVQHREEHGLFESTEQLANLVAGAARRRPGGKMKIHPATLTFQALRIHVNAEMDVLERALPDAIHALRPGSGRLAVISFHSLEDRIVKQTFKEYALETGGVRILTKRPIVAEVDESRRNPRARSAKLRVVERLEEGMVPQRKRNKYPRRTEMDNIQDMEDTEEI